MQEVARSAELGRCDGFLEDRGHAFVGCPGRGRLFAHGDRSGRLVDHHEVREGPPDVDTDARCHGGSLRTPGMAYYMLMTQTMRLICMYDTIL